MAPPQKSYGALEDGLEDKSPKSQEPPRYGAASRVLGAIALFALGFAAVRAGLPSAKTVISLDWNDPDAGSWKGDTWSAGDGTGTDFGDGTPSPAPVELPPNGTDWFTGNKPLNIGIAPDETDTITGNEGVIDKYENSGTVKFTDTFDPASSTPFGSDSTMGQMASGDWQENMNNAMNSGMNQMKAGMKNMDQMSDMSDMKNLQGWAKTQGAVISPADSVDTIPDGTTYENYVNSPNGVTNFGGTPTGVKPGQVTHTQGGGTVYNNQGMTTDVNQPLTPFIDW